MKKEEYELLKDVEENKKYIITSKDLINKKDRTLLYGYNVDRETWHVYLENNQIFAVKYRFEGPAEQLVIECNDDYIPNKRLYPERCDCEFCELLKKYGCELTFTTWTDGIRERDFYGNIL